jgi:hypothetical protein
VAKGSQVQAASVQNPDGWRLLIEYSTADPLLKSAIEFQSMRWGMAADRKVDGREETLSPVEQPRRQSVVSRQEVPLPGRGRRPLNKRRSQRDESIHQRRFGIVEWSDAVAIERW